MIHKHMNETVRIITKQCVNSKWIADWLAEKDQECCQCIVECKIRVYYRGREIIVTKKEYKMLISKNSKINILNDPQTLT